MLAGDSILILSTADSEKEGYWNKGALHGDEGSVLQEDRTNLSVCVPISKASKYMRQNR